MCNFLSAVVEFNPAENRITVHTTPDATHHEKIISHNHLNDNSDLIVRVEYTSDHFYVQNAAPWWSAALAADVEAQLARTHEILSHAEAIAEDRGYRAIAVAAQSEDDRIEAVQQTVMAAMIEGMPIPGIPEKYIKNIAAALYWYREAARDAIGRTPYKPADTKPQSKKLRAACTAYRATLAGGVIAPMIAEGTWAIKHWEDRDTDARTDYQERHGYAASSRRVGYEVHVYRRLHGICRRVKTYLVADYRKPLAIAAEIARAEKWAKRYAMSV